MLMIRKSFVAPYLRDGQVVGGYDNHRRPKAKIPGALKQADMFAAAAGADPTNERLEALSKRVVRIASGLSRANDFTPAAHAGHAIGVEAGQLNPNVIDKLAEAAVDWKAQIFVDSGAFPAFMAAVKAGGKPEPLDYDRQVFPKYDALLDRIGELNEADLDAPEPEGAEAAYAAYYDDRMGRGAQEEIPPPLLVMPDVVGDQAASLRLVEHHKAYVKAICDFPGVARAIIPIQSGELSMAASYRELVRILGTDNFICGIPSNAAAISGEEFKAFLAEAKPRGVHILGALADVRLKPRLAQIVESGHEPEWVSADANPLRSQIMEQGQTKDERQARIRDRLGERARHDELDAWLEANGGVEGLRTAYEAADGDRKFRIMGLLKDLSGLATDQVAERYGLSLPPFRTGWTLPAAERAALLAEIPPAYGRPIAHHVTFKTATGGSEVPTAAADGEIIGIADDGKGVQAAVVKLNGSTDRPDGGTYHITWSLAPGRKPVESNAVIEEFGWRPLAAPIPIQFPAPAQ